MQLWDRDDSVRNYAYLRTSCVNAMTTWRRRRNQEKMCILPHDPRQHNGGMLPLHMAVRIDRHHDLREVRVLQDDVIRGVAARVGRRLRDAFRRGVGLLDSRGVLVLAGLRLRVLESTPSLLSPGKRCKELGYRFIREPFCDPMFFDPKGKRLKIDVINNIPYLLFSETDLPRVYPALPAPIIVHEKVVAVGEAPQGELDEIGELVLDMPQEEKGGPRSSGDKRDVGVKPKGSPPPPPPPPPPEPRAHDLKEEPTSIRHLMTHLLKDPYCDACQHAKMEKLEIFLPGLSPR